MKKLFFIISLLLVAVISEAGAQNKSRKALREEVNAAIEDTLTNEHLDTLKIHKKLELNDYSMIGVQYGVGLSRVNWNPTQKQDMLFMPMNVGVFYTKYGKMFGYMPYFGFESGLVYTTEGYQFKYNEEDNYTYTIAGERGAWKQDGPLHRRGLHFLPQAHERTGMTAPPSVQ